MTTPTSNFVIHSRRYGYLHRGGFSRDEHDATIFVSLSTARDAARAAAKLYGVCVAVTRTARRSWRDARDEQNARTIANRDALDSFIAKCERVGVLILDEPHGRKYTY
jgi:hypothetical protein